MAEAVIGLVGVVIGAIITALFTWFLDYLRNVREQKIYIARKREETYLKAIDCLISMGTDLKWLLSGEHCNEIKEKVNSTIPYIKLYASEKIKKKYSSLQKELQNNPNEKTGPKIENLIKNIKKELNIE